MTKTIFKLLTIVLALTVFVGCEEDLKIFDAQNGQTAISFGGPTARTLSIPIEGLSVDIPVNSTTVSDVDRTFSVVVDANSTGNSSQYTIGSALIPANEFVGVMTVDFNYDAMVDGEQYDLILNLQAPEGGASYKDVLTFSYFREIVCNDVEVSIVFDDWAEETSWQITNTSGDVVASGGPYPGQSTFSQTVFLEDGCYTFTIFDAFGDGICCTYGEGSYAVTCSILVHASGGEFGGSESTDFCVNP